MTYRCITGGLELAESIHQYPIFAGYLVSKVFEWVARLAVMDQGGFLSAKGTPPYRTRGRGTNSADRCHKR